MDLMTAKEAAQRYPIKSAWGWLDMAKRGLCPCIRVGRRVFFRRESIDQWLNDLETKSVKQAEPVPEYGTLRRIQA